MKRLYDDRKLMYKVCSLYYNDNLTQDHIAAKLGLSRPTICRLIQNAREYGIVKIELIDPTEHSFSSLERAMEERFDLKEVIITESAASPETTTDLVGKATEAYLERIMHNGDFVGVSMGRCVSRIAKYKTGNKKYPASTFIPLLGGSGLTNVDIHSNQIVMELANAFGSNYQLLHVPSRVSDTTLIETFKRDKYIHYVFELMDRVTIALVGIGCLSKDSTMFSTGYYTDTLLEEMASNSIVGDILLQAFDKDGIPNMQYNKYVLGENIEKLKNMSYSIGIAFGSMKVPAIIASMRSKYINALITDYDTAKEILATTGG